VWDTLSFDVDGTLVRRDAAVRELLRSEFDDARVDEAMALDDREDNDALFAWLVEHGRFASHGAARAWFRRALPRHVRPVEAVTRTLEELARRHTLVVISNGGAAQRTKLAHAGLARFFAHVYVSAEARSRKPAGAMFRRAAADTNTPVGRMLHVGDDPLADIAGAHAAGLGTCWVCGNRALPAETPRPTLRVHDVTELPRRLPC